jgi:hypothetical protein
MGRLVGHPRVAMSLSLTLLRTHPMQYIKFYSLKAIQRGMLTGKAPRPTYVPVPLPPNVQPMAALKADQDNARKAQQ